MSRMTYMTPVHPGEHLAEELQALDLRPTELARQLRVPPNRINHGGAP